MSIVFKVLCSTVQGDKIICGCQYGVLVIWDLAAVLAGPRLLVSVDRAALVVYEHSAAISSLHIDTEELITDDYDGVIILRWQARIQKR